MKPNCIFNKNYSKIELIEFYITAKCNFNCEYCYGDFSPQKSHANDETIDNFIKLIPKLHKNAYIKLIGGEPTFHPRFSEVANYILKKNYCLDIGTNFSLPNEIYENLLACSKLNNQIRLIVSLHLSQIKSIPDFINKITSLKDCGKNKLSINVVSVLLEDKLEYLKDIHEELKTHGVNMSFQRLKIIVDGIATFQNYSDDTEKYLKETFPQRKASKIEDLNPYGMLCKTGYSFVRIDTDGNVYRCYDFNEKLFNLGSINKDWKNLRKIMPCLSDKCTCLLPVNRGLLMFDKYNKRLADKILKS